MNNRLIALFEEKASLLESFLKKTAEYSSGLRDESVPMDQKIDMIDEISDVREQNLKLMQALDQEIERTRKQLSPEEIGKLQTGDSFRALLERTLELIKEIQLTDQSLFLYIQSIGSEIRSQILKSLKEKEAVSKFKSQSQSSSGDEVDQTV